MHPIQLQILRERLKIELPDFIFGLHPEYKVGPRYFLKKTEKEKSNLLGLVWFLRALDSEIQ